jgi:polysaccharide deacetylase family protein (PEP-CTERM system associated)
MFPAMSNPTFPDGLKMPQQHSIKNVFSVDVEDYFQVSAFAGSVDPLCWDDYESRVVRNTQRILRRLEEAQIRGTFFILGWVAQRFPQLVRDIDRAGHEIGCHSFWHRLVYDLTPDTFRDDLRHGRDVLEQIVGRPVVAYRAPSFSIVPRSLWALDILVEEGFRYDSSIFPVRHDRYGIPRAEPSPHEIECAQGWLWEFPPAVYRLLGGHVPIAGGGYFRLFPLWFSLRGLRAVNQQAGQPFIFYLHPWELDPDQPRLRGPWGSRLRHYVNLGATERKLTHLLRAFEFDILSQVLEQRAWRTVISLSEMRHRFEDAAKSAPNPVGLRGVPLE